MTSKQEVLKELLIGAKWVSPEHIDKIMLLFDVDASEPATTKVVPPPAGSRRGNGGYPPSRNPDPTVVAAMEAIRDWVRVNHGYTGTSNNLAKMMEELGIKISTQLARQIVSEAGLEWPSKANWDRYRFDPRGGGGAPRTSNLLTDDPAVIEAYSLLMDHLGVFSRQETYHLGTEEVRSIIEIPPGLDWSRGQGFRRSKKVNAALEEEPRELVRETLDIYQTTMV